MGPDQQKIVIKKQRLDCILGTKLYLFLTDSVDAITRPMFLDGFILLQDRNPEFFSIIIDYVRDQFYWEHIEDPELDKHVREEAKFWEIPQPPTKPMLEMQEIFNSEPEKIFYRTLHHWKELGPFNMLELIRKKVITFDNNL